MGPKAFRLAAGADDIGGLENKETVWVIEQRNQGLRRNLREALDQPVHGPPADRTVGMCYEGSNLL